MRSAEDRELIVALGGEEQDFGFYHKKSDPPRNVPIHIHSSYEIYYLVSGMVMYLVEDRSYRVQPGDLIVVNRKERHAPVILSHDVPLERYVIHFKPQFVSMFAAPEYSLLSFLRKTRLGENSLLRSEDCDTGVLLEYLKRIEQEVIRNDSAMYVLIQSLFVQLLVALNKHCTPDEAIASTVIRNGGYDTKIIPILSYIYGNLTDRLSLDAIAREFSLSKYHLCRLFKASTGMTIGEYINHQRVARVTELLRQGHSAADAASKAGFSQYSTCYKAFKKVTGSTPALIMEQERARKQSET